jgi:hypothetical protein
VDRPPLAAILEVAQTGVVELRPKIAQKWLGHSPLISGASNGGGPTTTPKHPCPCVLIFFLIFFILFEFG